MVNGNDRHIRADSYTLTFPDDRPYVYLDDSQGRRLAQLFVLSSAHPMTGRDDTVEIGDWEVNTSSSGATFCKTARSSVWDRKTYCFRCEPRRFSYDITIEGSGQLAEVTYFGGYSSAMTRWGSGFFGSGSAFQRGFSPEPGAADNHYFEAIGNRSIDMVGAPLPGKRHWFFNPPPFCFAFECPGVWLGFGLEARPGANRFTEFRYNGGEGFSFSVQYDGQTEVNGVHTLPSVAVDFAADAYDVLSSHVLSLYKSGAAAPATDTPASWWVRPMFCGWGAQCDRAARAHGYAPGDGIADPGAFVETLKFASEYARQDVYDEFLQELAREGIVPGTVVIDDKWQATYGENEADRQKWPDLSGFVDRCHGDGQKVLLWLKAWDREGVPEVECIRNAAGLPLAVDPTNPRFAARLRASVHRMLSGDDYDADGFKIDFSHRIPSGPCLSIHGDVWGLELMKLYLEIIHDEAKRTKPDALVVTNTPNPYLAGVLDMIRLNDMLDLTRLADAEVGRDLRSAMEARARIARIACPHALIDTDNWPVRDRASWRSYVRSQRDIGVPSLYFTSRIDLTGEPLESHDYALIREGWA